MAGSDKQVVAYLGMLPFLAEIRELVTARRHSLGSGITLSSSWKMSSFIEGGVARVMYAPASA